MSNEVVVSNNEWMSEKNLVEQVTHIQHIMGAVMRKDEHYGVIPGCKKPSLYKAGAEKLCLVFRLFPEFIVVQKDLQNDHREISVTCVLKNQSGFIVGQGVGSCSTMESKYRWRQGGDLEATGKAVPKSYWDAKNAGDNAAATSLLGGKGFAVKKDDSGTWMIMKKGDGRVENPDIADQWNTVLKMAKKRAHVDAAITATASSDLFTQDVEDLPQFAREVPQQHTTTATIVPDKTQESATAYGASKAKELGFSDNGITELLGTDDWDNANLEGIKRLNAKVLSVIEGNKKRAQEASK